MKWYVPSWNFSLGVTVSDASRWLGVGGQVQGLPFYCLRPPSFHSTQAPAAAFSVDRAPIDSHSPRYPLNINVCCRGPSISQVHHSPRSSKINKDHFSFELYRLPTKNPVS